MMRQLREIRKEADRQMAARTYKRDAEGRVIIPMNVKADDDFLSEFSVSDTPVISAEVAEFIENSTHAVSPKEALTLQIHSDCIDEEEQVIYDRAIKEYYMQRYMANKKEMRHNRWLVWLLGVMGIMVLVAEILFDYLMDNAIWTEVIDIIAWVLLWEAVDIGVLQNRQQRLTQRRCLTYLCMKIEYMPFSTKRQGETYDR